MGVWWWSSSSWYPLWMSRASSVEWWQIGEHPSGFHFDASIGSFLERPSQEIFWKWLHFQISCFAELLRKVGSTTPSRHSPSQVYQQCPQTTAHWHTISPSSIFIPSCEHLHFTLIIINRVLSSDSCTQHIKFILMKNEFNRFYWDLRISVCIVWSTTASPGGGWAEGTLCARKMVAIGDCSTDLTLLRWRIIIIYAMEINLDKGLGKLWIGIGRRLSTGKAWIWKMMRRNQLGDGWAMEIWSH